MVIPVLKGIDFIGNQDDLNNSKVRATAYISEENDLGADCFHFEVMTPEYLAKIVSENETFNGRATFIVSRFDIALLETKIIEILKDCIRLTWVEVAKAINRHLNWEYDNMQFLTEEEILERLE